MANSLANPNPKKLIRRRAQLRWKLHQSRIALRLFLKLLQARLERRPQIIRDVRDRLLAVGFRVDIDENAVRRRRLRYVQAAMKEGLKRRHVQQPSREPPWDGLSPILWTKPWDELEERERQIEGAW